MFDFCLYRTWTYLDLKLLGHLPSASLIASNHADLSSVRWRIMSMVLSTLGFHDARFSDISMASGGTCCV